MLVGIVASGVVYAQNELLTCLPQSIIMAADPEPGQISFVPLWLDPRLMPVEAFGRAIKAALRHHGPSLLAYGDPQGFAPLRQSLARRLGQHGIQVSAEEILITHGAQQALDLALRGLTRPGDAVLVESPTYDQMLNLLAVHGLRAVPLPVTRTRPGAAWARRAGRPCCACASATACRSWRMASRRR